MPTIAEFSVPTESFALAETLPAFPEDFLLNDAFDTLADRAPATTPQHLRQVKTLEQLSALT